MNKALGGGLAAADGRSHRAAAVDGGDGAVGGDVVALEAVVEEDRIAQPVEGLDGLPFIFANSEVRVREPSSEEGGFVAGPFALARGPFKHIQPSSSSAIPSACHSDRRSGELFKKQGDEGRLSCSAHRYVPNGDQAGFCRPASALP